MKALRLSALIVLGAIMLSVTATAQDWSKFEVKTTKIGGGVDMLNTAGGNVAVYAGETGLFVVDADYDTVWKQFSEALAEYSNGPVRYVVNTHWHFDHVGGNAGFITTGATVISHENVRKRMAAGQLIEIIDREVEPSPAGALPTLTYSGGIVMWFGGEEIAIVHPENSHTDGDSVVHFRKAGVIHVGDIWFNGGFPFIDVSSGGSIDGMITAVTQVLELCGEDTKIIPGHGPLGDKTGLREYLDMLQQYRDLVAADIAAGKDLEGVKASQSTAALDEKYGKVYFPPETFKEMVYRSLVP